MSKIDGIIVILLLGGVALVLDRIDVPNNLYFSLWLFGVTYYLMYRFDLWREERSCRRHKDYMDALIFSESERHKASRVRVELLSDESR